MKSVIPHLSLLDSKAIMKKLEADSTETKSVDIIAENIESIKAMFPEVITEGKIDFDVLKELLGNSVDDREERYGLNWNGKRFARQIALTPSTGTLLPSQNESSEWDTTHNLMIEGENLEVLKILQKSYTGKVKLIYIDPPYNTGKDFIYADRFQDSIRDYLLFTGQSDLGGHKISSNTESSGRFHTNWLNLMYPRLRLARNLLKNDGIFLVSIDDNEVHHLRLILDSIFGSENFLGSLIWEGGRKNDARLISLSHDYILAYAKDATILRERDTRWRERKAGLDQIYRRVAELRAALDGDYDAIHVALHRWYRELPDGDPSKAHDHFNYVDERGIYFPDNLRSPNPRPNLVFEWKGYKPHPNGWAYGRDKMAELDREGRLCYPLSTDQRIKLKSYLHEHEYWAPGSVFYKDRRAASNSLSSLMGAEVFDFPKDAIVIKRFIESITSENDVILDFFAGSGTTGHAVLALNGSQPLQRKFILVQLPESLNLEDKKQQVAANYCDTFGKPRNIAELTKERLRRAVTSIRNDNPDTAGDLGFRVFRLASSNIQAWSADAADLESSLLDNAEHLVQGRKEQDVLYELLLKLGLDLCVQIEGKTIAGKLVHSIGSGALIVCLADGLTKDVVETLALGIVDWWGTLAPAVDTRLVFKDSGFADDISKTNMAAILTQNGLSDIRSL